MKQGKTNVYSTEIDKLILNLPALTAITDVQNSSVFKAIVGVQSLPALAAIADVQNSSVFKAIVGVQSLPTLAAIADVQNSSAFKAIAGVQNLPAIKAIAGVQNSPAFAFSKSLKDINNLQSLALSSFEGIEIYSTKPLKIPIIPLFELENKIEKDSLEKEAKIACKRNEFNFNTKAYEFLCDLEVSLRYLIQEKIITPYESNLETKIPKTMLEQWLDKKQRDNQSNNEDYDLIYYSDFTDLKIIFEKRKNKTLFKELFNDEEYDALIVKLHELDPIRKKIAHFRPLTERDFERLVLYHYDILTVVQN